MAHIVQMYPFRGKTPVSNGCLPKDLIQLKSELKRELTIALKSVIRTSLDVQLKKWLTGPQVQRKLNLTAGALRRLRSEGSISYCQIGAEIYFDPIDVDKALRRRKRIKAA